MTKSQPGELAANPRAFHDYEILETFEAGIALVGTEVKSLRHHGGNLREGYIKIMDDEAWLIGSSIAPYTFGNVHNHEERRDRKLLLHKNEIIRLRQAVAEKGLTLIPLAFYLKKGRIKLRFGLAKGKKHHDKRASLIEKEKKKELDRAMKRYR